MKPIFALCGLMTLGVVAFSAQSCGGSSESPGAPDAGAPDGDVADSNLPTDAPSGDTGTDADCPPEWTVAPVVDPPISVPDGGGGVLLHASASGTQNYACSSVTTDGGMGYAWVFTGPEADLADCAMTKIGEHFASDGGPGAPEWITLSDGTYVIGKKLAAETPDGGGGAIPWLLLQATAHGGGTGPLSHADFVQRVHTTGGISPSATCDGTTVGMTEKVPYTADYYFFGM